MGNSICGAGMTPEERAAISASAKLDRELTTQQTDDARVLKLLLLGTGESGKSTIFKQMQILHDNGFSDMETSTFRHVIRTNVVESMQTLVGGLERFRIDLSASGSEEAVKRLMLLDPLSAGFWNPAIAQWVTHLWTNEPGIQQAFARRSEMQILDSAPYLFENVSRIAGDNYNPTQNDILRARLRTSGIVERNFMINTVDFKFLDVGGQRNERRKWIHCFENVTSVIFVAAISEYDQTLYEDESENRLRESIKVFQEICNNVYFEETAMILFLNKMDLFEEKIARKLIDTKGNEVLDENGAPQFACPLNKCFDDYDGANTYDDASSFIQSRFLEVKENKDKMVFCHLTCATDTENVQRVFEACKLVILKESLEKLGLS